MATMLQKTARHLCLVLLCSVFAAGSFDAAQAQGYQLQKGDTVTLDIIRLPGASWVSTVNSDGRVRFPIIGEYQADGMTLDALKEAIILNVVGRQVSGLSATDDSVVILNDDAIFMDIAGYRPMTIFGAVARPGQLDYVPGMTLRAAIGAAGGYALALDAASQPNQVFSLDARLDELRQTEAWLMLDLWRIRGQLDPAEKDTVPEEYAAVVQARLDQAFIDAVPVQVDQAVLDLEKEFENLNDRIVLTEGRIAFLTTALTQYQEVSQAEEEQLANSLRLLEQGLVVTGSVNNARSAALSASSRLLSTEADIAETQRELLTLIDTRDNLYDSARSNLLGDLANARRALDEIGIRISGVERQIAYIYGQTAETDSAGAPTIRVVLRRQIGPDVVMMEPDLDQPVLPGDIVEVELIHGED